MYHNTTNKSAAEISLSLSILLPSHSHFISARQISAIPPNKLKLPSQISLRPPKPFIKPTVSANPVRNSRTPNPMCSSNPAGTAAFRRAVVVWFRNDLRIHDNECLTAANRESISVLPFYCFDPRNYVKSSSGYDITGHHRAKFLMESVSDLRKNLQDRGSDLVVRVGRPESVLLEMVKAVGADAVYMHREVSHDEVKAEEKIEEVMKDEGVEVKYFWGSTLYHLEDLPFELGGMPTNYGGFKERVKVLEVRKTIEALDRMKDLPKRGNVETGEIPSLVDLGLNPAITVMAQNEKTTSNDSLVGGETEALQRLRKFAAEFKAKPNNGFKNEADDKTDGASFTSKPRLWKDEKTTANPSLVGGEPEALQRLRFFAGESKEKPNNEFKNGADDKIDGVNFSSKLSPWLSTGCLSPRFMFYELNKSASTIISGAGMDCLHELMWRDFFRFIVKKYSSVKLQRDAL